MLRLPNILRKWLLGAAARVEAPLDKPDLGNWSSARESSGFACALAMFRRAAEPLDGVHPDLATLLAHNRDRDVWLNEELTRLANQSDMWRERLEASEHGLALLRPRLASARAAAESAEAEATSVRNALHRMQQRYVAFCAKALNSVAAERAIDVVDQPDASDGTWPGGHNPSGMDERVVRLRAGDRRFRLLG